MNTCHHCRQQFLPEEDAEQTKLCYHCFEESLEAFEERKRERLARENEY